MEKITIPEIKIEKIIEFSAKCIKCTNDKWFVIVDNEESPKILATKCTECSCTVRFDNK